MTTPVPANTAQMALRNAADAHAAEVARGERFKFGENWRKFLEHMSEERAQASVVSLRRMLGLESLAGLRFLDIGSGSGLFSLAAHRLGAEVTSFDYDGDSVGCTNEMRRRYAPGSTDWKILQGSVLDADFMQALGQFDVVYSWGVLHHTGDMYGALRAAAQLVKPGGTFIFALYRKTWLCRFWRWEKQWYARASARRQEIASAIFVRLFALGLLLQRRSFKSYVGQYRSSRGMDYFHDVHDWLGGYPYESISPEETERFLNPLGFHLERSFVRKGVLLGRCSGVFGSGCDEYVYTRN